MLTALKLLINERLRQITVKGRTAEHDDKLTNGELAVTASYLLASHAEAKITASPDSIDASPLTEKNDDPVINCIVAGALALAEAERLLRLRQTHNVPLPAPSLPVPFDYDPPGVDLRHRLLEDYCVDCGRQLDTDDDGDNHCNRCSAVMLRKWYVEAKIELASLRSQLGIQKDTGEELEDHLKAMPEQDAITCIIHDLYESWRYDTKQFSTTTSFAGYLGGEIYRLRSLLRDRSESLSKDRDRVVRVLNEAYRKDPCAINKLFSLEVVCTSGLADHPTIQVKSYETDTDASTYYTLRLIGLINGLVGCDLHRQGFIAEVHDDHGKLVGFTTVNNNVKRNATWPREIPDVLDEIRSKAEAVMQVGIPAPDGVWEDAKAALSAYVAKNPYAVSHLVGRLEEAQNELNWLKYGIRSENYPGTPHPSKTPEGR